MIHDFSICFEQEQSDHNNNHNMNHHNAPLLEVKLESRQRESSNMSTCGSFSQPSSDYPCDLTSSPMLSNQDEAEADHECQIIIDLDQPTLDTTSKVSLILDEIVKFQKSIDKRNSRMRKSTCFTNSCIPSILLNQYINNVVREAKLELDICVVGLFYVDRLIRQQPNFSINEYNCHRLILTSLMIASKMHQDIQAYHYPIKLFSLIGGISESELFIMEQAFLNLLNYKLFIDEEEYVKYKQQLYSFSV